MSKPKVFIGSSQINLRVAKILAEGLEAEDCTDEVKVWDEDAFDLNRGFLETLLCACQEYDFAVFVFAPDDITTSKEETTPSPRDNVLFEAGLFMGAMGLSRVFIVCDQSSELKIPSDFAGVTLASYDGTRIDGEDALSAVRRACRLISDHIRKSQFRYMIGEWKSIYRKSDAKGHPLVEEDVEITTCGKDKIIIASLRGTRPDDYYKAQGRMTQKDQIRGEWKSHEDSCDTSGIFILTVNPGSTFMYGYFTTPDPRGGSIYADWALAKKTDADAATVNERLEEAKKILTETINLPPLAS